MDKMVTFLENQWHKKTGLVVALVVTAGAATTFLKQFNLSPIKIVVYLSLTELFLLISWVLCNRLPKNEKGKIGFIVCINTKEESYGEKLREDFVVPLKTLIKTSKTSKFFKFMALRRFKWVEHIAC